MFFLNLKIIIMGKSAETVNQNKEPHDIQWIFFKFQRYSLKELGLLDSVSILQIRPGMFKEVFRRFLAHFLIL